MVFEQKNNNLMQDLVNDILFCWSREVAFAYGLVEVSEILLSTT